MLAKPPKMVAYLCILKIANFMCFPHPPSAHPPCLPRVQDTLKVEHSLPVWQRLSFSRQEHPSSKSKAF